MAGYWQLATLIFIITYFVSVTTDEARFAAELCEVASVPLVTGPHGVSDDAFSASSTWVNSYRHSPHQARINRTLKYSEGTHQSAGGWVAGHAKSGEWIQVKLKSVSTICSIQTQSRNHYKQYVKSFHVKVSLDCKIFDVTPGRIKVFNGNNDMDTIVTNKLHTPVLALCVRLVVTSFYIHPSLRFDLLGFRGSSCASRSHPLVSGKDGVSDAAFTASTIFHNVRKFSAFHGRLQKKASHTSAGGWCPMWKRIGDWIQVRFTNWKTICSVQTQGRDRYNQFVTRYRVMVSDDCNSWKNVDIQPGVWKIFNGNTDDGTVVKNGMPAPVSALCLRLYIHAFHNFPAMRFEVLGFRESPCKGSVALVSGKHGIPDSALTASSVLKDILSASPSDARLGVLYKKGISAGGWVAGNKRAGEWIQVKFPSRKTICSILTLGRDSFKQFVKTFYFAFSLDHDCQSFTYIKENGVKKLFYGNKDNDSIVTNALLKPVSALCVRIVVDKYNKHPAMRFELFGIKGRLGNQKCSANLCKNGGTCMMAASGYSCKCTPDYAGRDCENVNSCKNAFALFNDKYDGTKNDVPDSAFSASTVAKDHGVIHHAHFARRIDSQGKPWWARTNLPMDWVQVRLNNLCTICSVQTRGGGHFWWSIFHMSTYFLQYSQDCVTFKDYAKKKNRIIFYGGDYKRHWRHINTVKLPVPITALCVRLVMLTFRRNPGTYFRLIGFPINKEAIQN